MPWLFMLVSSIYLFFVWLLKMVFHLCIFNLINQHMASGKYYMLFIVFTYL